MNKFVRRYLVRYECADSDSTEWNEERQYKLQRMNEAIRGSG